MFDWIKQWGRDSLWAPPAIALVISIAVIWAAYAFGDRVDPRFGGLDRARLMSLLGVFASSMLAISSFTVSAIVTASSSAAARATPRASQFVVRDLRSQFVLASFVSGFIYSIAGIVAVSVFDFEAGARFLLVLGLMAIAILVLIAFVIWVDGILKLGLQSTILDKLLDAAMQSAVPHRVGTLGARSWDGNPPDGASAIYPQSMGYVSAFDLPRLQAFAEAEEAEIYLAVRFGDFVDPTLPIAHVRGAQSGSEAIATAVNGAVLLYAERNAATDLRFNLLNLSEVAGRALSPGINDPGTAIAVLDLLLRVLRRWAGSMERTRATDIVHGRLHLRGIEASELLEGVFTPIARDGAGVVEVAERLQSVLSTLARCGDEEMAQAAKIVSKQAVAYSEEALLLDEHLERIRDLSDTVGNPEHA